METPLAALSGLKVVEISHAVAAAYCGRQFAAWGADVVIIEPSGGSPLRRMRPIATGRDGAAHSLLFQYVAANKRCLKREALASADAWQRLFASTDVVIVDADATGVPELGLSWAALRERHPHLCVIAVTPFGLDGPYASYRGAEIVVQALSGYLALNGERERAPLRAPGHLLGYAAGVNAFIGGLAAYLKRLRTGHGDLVEISELESIASIVPFLRVQYLAQDKRREGGSEPGVRIVPCADGFVSLVVPVDGSAKELYHGALGIPPDAWPTDLPEAHHARVRHVLEFIASYTRKLSADAIFHAFEQRGVTCGKLIRPGALPANEQLSARGFFRTLEHPELGALPFAGPAGKLRASGPVAPAPAPRADDAVDPAKLGWQPIAQSASRRTQELPLHGVKIVDLTQAWIGPFMTLMLADLGADVVKVESHKRPDVWRQPSPLPVAIKNILAERVNRSHYFNSVNRNKRSLTLDLGTERGRALLVALTRDAHIIAENYSPTVMTRWGLSHAALAEIAPSLVIVSSSGFGKSGPWSHYRSNGAAIETLSGWDALHAYPGGDPILMGFYQADAITGFQLAALTLVAFVRRMRTGQGESIDAAMFEAASGYLGELIMYAQLAGEIEACGNRSADMAPHGVFRCDGHDRWIAIAVPDDAAYAALLKLPGCPPQLAQPEFATTEGRLEAQAVIEGYVATFTASRDADALMAELQAAGIAAGVVRSPLEAVEEPHLSARSWFQTMTHPDVGTHKYNGFPWRFADCELRAHTPPPRLGEHAELLLREKLGLSVEEIAALIKADITGAVL